MKKFKVKRICGLGIGTLVELDAKQVDRRRHMLDDTDAEGVYLTKSPVQFKVGEVIGVDPSLIGKDMVDAFESEEAPKEAEPKADQKPKPNQGRKK